ncbi:MAG TPA: hypothetical protein VES20_04120, partial [Bryobacteraceae bacterium]|nr:hypothetical protein [Bryobacteraceae bacterium]
FTLGLYAPRWTRAHFPDFPSVGRFESAVFDPIKWVPEYKNPAFLNELPDDAFWAARQIMAFTDEHVRAVVASGQYSDPAAAEWVTKCLIERRDKIGRAYLASVLALDRFSVEKGELRYADLAVIHKVSGPSDYSVAWSEFDNATDSAKALPGFQGLQIPRVKAEYVRATIRGGDDRRSIDVYIRNPAAQAEVVGVERHW